MSAPALSRREFLVGSGVITGGLVLGCAMNPRAAAPAKARGAFAPNAWLQITPDDQVIFQLDKVEMGQGVLTALSTIVAEELEIDPRRIVVQMAHVDPEFQTPLQITGGSSLSVSARTGVKLAACSRSSISSPALADVCAVAHGQRGCEAIAIMPPGRRS